MKQEILKDLENTTDELLKTLDGVKSEDVDRVPFEGSWTAGQLAEHLLKSDETMLKILNGETKKSERKHDEKVEGIKKIFLNFSSKMKAPDFNTPLESVHKKDNIVSTFEENKKGFSDVIKSKELSEICTGFSLPGLGEMTRYEWIYFNIYHKQRHTHQLKNIVQKL